MKNKIIKRILDLKKHWPILIWINWIDGSWKTYFSKEIKRLLEDKWKKVILVSVDDFHNPKNIRYEKWRNSPEWFYKNSYNYYLFKKYLLDSFLEWKWSYITKLFDLDNNSFIEKNFIKIEWNEVLIVEGIFLFRPELIDYWDLKIFLDVKFEEIINRTISREKDIKHLWAKKEIIEKYNIRYIPWQKLYFKEVDVKNISDIVIDNNDYLNPIIIKI